MRKMRLGSLLGLAVTLSAPPIFADAFVQTNLVSDIPGMATTTDPNLKNPWGMSFSTTSPIWVSDQASNTSTLYSGAGSIIPLVVSVPGGPTGQVFAGGAGFSSGGTSFAFVFDTLSGTIAGWGGGTSAVLAQTTAGASYAGLALASSGGSNYLYAANFIPGGGINVFNSSFTPVKLAGSFTDPNLPVSYAPHNIQQVGGKLYVEYSKIDSAGNEVVGAGLGYVDVFNTDGTFVKRLTSQGALNSPWGVTQAPKTFGKFSNSILIGNFGDGKINAYDPTSGSWLGVLTDAKGNPIVNSALWGIEAGNVTASPAGNALFFNAGINGEADGLFGKIQFTPEPTAWSLLALGGLFTAGVNRFRRSRPS